MGTEDSPCHIVLAEDNVSDQQLVKAALREHSIHCNLRIISDGEEVLSFIEGLDLDSKLPCPDLVLLDMHLPKQDGVQVMKRLRASERCGRTPVVVLTSSESPKDRQNAEKNAAIHYFKKPADIDEFLRLGTIVKQIISQAVVA